MDIIVRKPTAQEIEEMKSMPTWEKEPSTFPWYYDARETCLIIDGEVEVSANGKTVSFKAGDLVIFPKGLNCTWTVKKPLRKYYKFD